MARTKDLWHKTAEGPDGKPARVPTARYGHGKRWLAVWTGPDGQEATKAFARKAEADRYGGAQETDQLRGVYVDPRAGLITLREYAEERWLPAQLHLRPNSATLYDAHLRNHILNRLGARPLGSIRRTDCKGFVVATSAVLAPSTTATVYAVFRSVMQAAVDDGLIAANPASRVPLPPDEPEPFVLLTAAETSALAAAMTARYQLAVWLAAGAGLREGEALGITLPRVEFLARRINVLQQMQNGVLSPLKTRASKRVVPVDDLVLDKINEHMTAWPPGPHQLLITGRTRQPVRRNAFGQCWRDAVKAASLPKGTRFHALRHFYASAQIAAGLNPKELQARLGHATLAESMDTYSHLFPSASEHGRGGPRRDIRWRSGGTGTEQERPVTARAQVSGWAAGERACRPGLVLACP